MLPRVADVVSDALELTGPGVALDAMVLDLADVFHTLEVKDSELGSRWSRGLAPSTSGTRLSSSEVAVLRLVVVRAAAFFGKERPGTPRQEARIQKVVDDPCTLLCGIPEETLWREVLLLLWWLA